MDVIAKPFIGELGHELLFWQAFLRFEKLKNHKRDFMKVCCLPGHEVIYEFADEIISVPEHLLCREMYHTQSTWECREIGESIEEWFHQFKGEGRIIRPEMEGQTKYRHGYHDLINNKLNQIFVSFFAEGYSINVATTLLTYETYRFGKYIVVYPRHKPGKGFELRNWGFWEHTINHLKEKFPEHRIVIAGVEGLVDPAVTRDGHVVAIQPAQRSDLGVQIALLQNAAFAVTPISGCSFLSLLSSCPTFVIGPEKCGHHIQFRNIFQTKAEYFSGPSGNAHDQMPYLKQLDSLFERLETFGNQCLDGRFSV